MYFIPQLLINRQIRHGVSTVSDGNMAFTYGEKNIVIENRKKFLQELKIPNERTIFLEVTHGTKIVEASQSLAGTGFNSVDLAIKADAIFTKEKNLALVILTGDCIPAIFFDKSNQLVGIVHISRHNTQKAFAQIVVNYLKREHRTNLQELKVYFAPSILKNSYILPDYPEGYDLVRENIEQLRLKGLGEENIYMGEVDTAKEAEFFSHYRAVREKSLEGRSANLVMLI